MYKILHKKKRPIAGAKKFQSQTKRIDATQAQSLLASFASNYSRSSGEEALILSPLLARRKSISVPFDFCLCAPIKKETFPSGKTGRFFLSGREIVARVKRISKNASGPRKKRNFSIFRLGAVPARFYVVSRSCAAFQYKLIRKVRCSKSSDRRRPP